MGCFGGWVSKENCCSPHQTSTNKHRKHKIKLFLCSCLVDIYSRSRRSFQNNNTFCSNKDKGLGWRKGLEKFLSNQLNILLFSQNDELLEVSCDLITVYWLLLEVFQWSKLWRMKFGDWSSFSVIIMAQDGYLATSACHLELRIVNPTLYGWGTQCP